MKAMAKASAVDEPLLSAPLEPGAVAARALTFRAWVLTLRSSIGRVLCALSDRTRNILRVSARFSRKGCARIWNSCNYLIKLIYFCIRRTNRRVRNRITGTSILARAAKNASQAGSEWYLFLDVGVYPHFSGAGSPCKTLGQAARVPRRMIWSGEAVMAQNPYARPAAGYSAVPRGGTPTYTEAWALIEASRRMAEAVAAYDQDQSKDNPRAIRDALRLNWRLWTVFQAEMTAATVPVSEDVRINILTLCKYVDTRTAALLVETTPEKVLQLVEINRQIATGLLEGLNKSVAAQKSATDAAKSDPKKASEKTAAAKKYHADRQDGLNQATSAG
ncbi:MAG: hypothetical protein FJX37_00360 [Alphaproteobacteria bacterium]|nr:hypothetical protein [Alphaproteobacteria bacterium]